MDQSIFSEHPVPGLVIVPFWRLVVSIWPPQSMLGGTMVTTVSGLRSTSPPSQTISLYIFLSHYLAIYISIYLSVCLSVNLSINLHLSIYLVLASCPVPSWRRPCPSWPVSPGRARCRTPAGTGCPSRTPGPLSIKGKVIFFLMSRLLLVDKSLYYLFFFGGGLFKL